MFNFVLNEYHEALTLVAHVHQATGDPTKFGIPKLTPEMCAELLPKFEFVGRLFMRMGMTHAARRTDWLLRRLRDNDMTGPNLRSDTASIHEGFKDDAGSVYCYSYSPEKARMVIMLDHDWATALKSFKSAEAEIRAAVDLLALGHSTACVFHLMRAAEVALRAIARERRVKLKKDKPIDSAQWQDIISGVNAQIREIGLKWKAGKRKEEALEFYSGAMGHMVSFKDKFRNQVSHSTRLYDEHEAASAMMHVREFMCSVGARLDETSKRQIKW